MFSTIHSTYYRYYFFLILFYNDNKHRPLPGK